VANTKRPRAARPVEGTATTPSDGAEPPVCTVAFCPICMAVTATQGAAPDAMEHLLNAAREFFLAARAVIDARADDLERSTKRTSRRIERIDIA
jgi:hypothetical protein